MADNILSKPTLIGTMRESPLYQSMLTGTTRPVLLIGHADANVMYQPYRVQNMQETVNYLKADSNAPLLRTLLEVYNSGVRDIWIYAAAPMNEYVDVNQDRMVPLSSLQGKALSSSNFYQKWFSRLQDVYSNLLEYDFFEIIVPVEAVHYDSGNVDFTTQLANFCQDYFSATGAVCMGVLGTRIPNFSQASINQMVNDTRISNLSDNGKFVFVVTGEGLVNSPQMPVTYKATLAGPVASMLSTTDMTRSVAGLLLPGVMSYVGNDLSDSQVQQLALAKVNPVRRTSRGKRGYSYQIQLMTDNTLAMNDSEYWSSYQTILLIRCINTIREYGWAFIGETDIEGFERAVNSYLMRLKNSNIIKDFSLDIDFQAYNNKAYVTVGLAPYTSIRSIYFTVETGPGV